jgi:hypothetical protein
VCTAVTLGVFKCKAVMGTSRPGTNCVGAITMGVLEAKLDLFIALAMCSIVSGLIKKIAAPLHHRRLMFPRYLPLHGQSLL